jgi:hypothetical protein
MGPWNKGTQGERSGYSSTRPPRERRNKKKEVYACMRKLTCQHSARRSAKRRADTWKARKERSGWVQLIQSESALNTVDDRKEACRLRLIDRQACRCAAYGSPSEHRDHWRLRSRAAITYVINVNFMVDQKIAIVCICHMYVRSSC